jgi:hypothetical protein
LLTCWQIGNHIYNVPGYNQLAYLAGQQNHCAIADRKGFICVRSVLRAWGVPGKLYRGHEKIG